MRRMSNSDSGRLDACLQAVRNIGMTVFWTIQPDKAASVHILNGELDLEAISGFDKEILVGSFVVM